MAPRAGLRGAGRARHVSLFFFFQAEDGIRDVAVTGVQTCALPIYVAGIGHLGTHAFRHTYRSWLDAVGTPIAAQQKLMRHSDIRTTMNIYGDVVKIGRASCRERV